MPRARLKPRCDGKGAEELSVSLRTHLSADSIFFPQREIKQALTSCANSRDLHSLDILVSTEGQCPQPRVVTGQRPNMCLHVAPLPAAIKVFSGMICVQGDYYQRILPLDILQLSSGADVFFLRRNRKVPFP